MIPHPLSSQCLPIVYPLALCTHPAELMYNRFQGIKLQNDSRRLFYGHAGFLVVLTHTPISEKRMEQIRRALKSKVETSFTSNAIDFHREVGSCSSPKGLNPNLLTTQGAWANAPSQPERVLLGMLMLHMHVLEPNLTCSFTRGTRFASAPTILLRNISITCGG